MKKKIVEKICKKNVKLKKNIKSEVIFIHKNFYRKKFSSTKKNVGQKKFKKEVP